MLRECGHIIIRPDCKECRVYAKWSKGHAAPHQMSPGAIQAIKDGFKFADSKLLEITSQGKAFEVKLVGKPIPIKPGETVFIPLAARRFVRRNMALGHCEVPFAPVQKNPKVVPWCRLCDDLAMIDVLFSYVYCPRGHGALASPRVLWKARRHRA